MIWHWTYASTTTGGQNDFELCWGECKGLGTNALGSWKLNYFLKELAEKCRAGGAGIPSFFTATGYGTEVAEGKETREIDGRMYVLEPSLTAILPMSRLGREIEWVISFSKEQHAILIQ